MKLLTAFAANGDRVTIAPRWVQCWLSTASGTVIVFMGNSIALTFKGDTGARVSGALQDHLLEVSPFANHIEFEREPDAKPEGA